MNQYKSNIWKMYLFKFMISLHFIGGVLVPFFLDWGKISFTRMMILQSIFVFSAFALEIPTGAIADYLGRKTSIILSGLIMVIAVFVYSSYPNFYIFILGEFFWALSFALLSGADQALVYDSLKKIGKQKTSKKIFGRFSSFQLAGIMVAAPIGSIIASKLGLRYTMMFMAFPALLGSIIALSFKEPKTTRKAESRSYINMVTKGIKYFKGHRILKILAFDAVSMFSLTFMIIWTYQPVLRQLNFPLFYFGFVHAAMAGVQIILMCNFERLEKIIGSKKKFLMWSALITGVGFILLGIYQYIPFAIFLIMIIGGIGLSRPVLLQNYMHKYIESHNRATVISTVSMLEKLSIGIAYPLVGLLVEWSLNFTLIIIGISIIVFSLISRVEEAHLID